MNMNEAAEKYIRELIERLEASSGREVVFSPEEAASMLVFLKSVLDLGKRLNGDWSRGG